MLRTIITHIVCLAVGFFSVYPSFAQIDDLISKLSIAVGNHDQIVIEQIAETLIKMNDSAIPLLKKGLDSEDKELKSQILKILLEIKTNASTEVILETICRQKDEYIVIESMQGLQYRNIGIPVDQQTLICILEKLKEGKLQFMTTAARILGKMKQVPPQVRAEPLIAVLQKDVFQGKFDNNKLLPHAYVTASQYAIRQLAFALEDIGTSAIPFIYSALDVASDSNYKNYLIICLGLCGDETILSKLEIVLNEAPDGHARALAAFALGKLGDKNSIPILKKALADPFSIKFQNGGNKEIFPVREEAGASLRALGVGVIRYGNEFIVNE